MPRDFGFSGLGLSLWMTPFSTTAITEHLFTHISQVVGISNRSASLAGGWLKGFMYAREAPIAAVAAPPVENLRNFRRSIRYPSAGADEKTKAHGAAVTSPCRVSRRPRNLPLLAAGLGLWRIGGVVNQKCRSIEQLVRRQVFRQRFLAVIVCPLRKISAPLLHSFVQGRNL